MSFQVVITQAAKQDLSDTFEYIYNDLQSPQAALHFLDKMETAIFSLDEFPERCPVYEDGLWQERKLRVMTNGNYRIYYIVDAQQQTVTVIRVLCHGRDEKPAKEGAI